MSFAEQFWTPDAAPWLPSLLPGLCVGLKSSALAKKQHVLPGVISWWKSGQTMRENQHTAKGFGWARAYGSGARAGTERTWLPASQHLSVAPGMLRRLQKNISPIHHHALALRYVLSNHWRAVSVTSTACRKATFISTPRCSPVTTVLGHQSAKAPTKLHRFGRGS